jgi:hypothetical protein
MNEIVNTGLFSLKLQELKSIPTTLPVDDDLKSTKKEVADKLKEIETIKKSAKKDLADKFDKLFEELVATETTDYIGLQESITKRLAEIAEEEKQERAKLIASSLKNLNKELKTSFKLKDLDVASLYTNKATTVENRLRTIMNIKIDNDLMASVDIGKKEEVVKEPEQVFVKITINELPYDDETQALIIELKRKGLSVDVTKL